jgi:hypothetical protein
VQKSRNISRFQRRLSSEEIVPLHTDAIAERRRRPRKPLGGSKIEKLRRDDIFKNIGETQVHRVHRGDKY